MLRTRLISLFLFLSFCVGGLAGHSLVMASSAAQKTDKPAPPAPHFASHFAKPPISPQPAPRLPPVQPAPQVRAQPTVPMPEGPVFDWTKTENYLVLGTDRRPGEKDWRTDTIMVLGLDRALNRAAVFSIPRDLYIEIPGYGWGRINQVDYIGERSNGFGGGPALVSQVLSKTLGINAPHWLRLQMDGFISLVDAIGGVTVHMDCPFYEPVFTGKVWDYFTLPAGDTKLDGAAAYMFVRLRYRESDIGRARRQRQFLWALRNQALNTNLILRAPELWGAFQNSFSTDLSLLQLIDLGRYGIGLEPGNVRSTGLTLADLQSYVTAQGAQVLRIADPARVQSIVTGVWTSAPAMVDTNHQDVTKCAPLPTVAAADLGLPNPSAPSAPITHTLAVTKTTP